MDDRQPQLINVSAETKEQADDFMTTLGEMFEIIEKLAEDSSINEGNYLVLANKFKKLSELKERTKTTYIYVEAQRTHTRGRVTQRKALTKAEKLKDEKFMSCPKCKKVITKRHYAEKHSKAGVCGHIEAVGNLLAHNKGEAKSDKRRVKISDKEMNYPIAYVSREKDKTQKKKNVVEIREAPSKQHSIAYRSLILAELWNPSACGADGVVRLKVECLVRREEDEDEEEDEEDESYETKTISFRQFHPDEGKNRWKKTAEGWKYINTIRVKRKLVLLEREKTTAC